MAEDKSICRSCFHSYVCEKFNEHRDDHNQKCYFFNDHFVPAADVAPVVHGRWIPCDPDSDVRFYCSECETEISTSWDYDCDAMWSFCPNCGAKMDKE